MIERFAIPSPSLIAEREVHAPDGTTLRAGICEPRDLDDDLWSILLWVADGERVVPLRRLASPAGPPADHPIARFAGAFAGGLAGWLREEDDRQILFVKLGIAPEDSARPWEAPTVIWAVIGWERMRAATMPLEERSRVALNAFVRAVEGLGRRF